MVDDSKNGDQKTKIADAIHDKSFFCCIIVIEIFKPVTDQQIRTESNTFPSNKHNHIIRAQHQQQHGEHKEIQVREIFCISPVRLPHAYMKLNTHESEIQRR